MVDYSSLPVLYSAREVSPKIWSKKKKKNKLIKYVCYIGKLGKKLFVHIALTTWCPGFVGLHPNVNIAQDLIKKSKKVNQVCLPIQRTDRTDRNWRGYTHLVIWLYLLHVRPLFDIFGLNLFVKPATWRVRVGEGRGGGRTICTPGLPLFITSTWRWYVYCWKG